MIYKIRLLFFSITSSAVLLAVLCLGSQNINNRYQINIGLNKTAPFPNGFIVGISICLGVISGGSYAAISMKDD